MDSTHKRITPKQIIDAMEQDGFKKAIGLYMEIAEDGTINSACAVGQAAINLGVEAEEVANILRDKSMYAFGPRISSYIFSENDETKKQVRTIAREVRKIVKDFGDYYNHEYLVRRANYKLKETK